MKKRKKEKRKKRRKLLVLLSFLVTYEDAECWNDVILDPTIVELWNFSSKHQKLLFRVDNRVRKWCRTYENPAFDIDRSVVECIDRMSLFSPTPIALCKKRKPNAIEFLPCWESKKAAVFFFTNSNRRGGSDFAIKICFGLCESHPLSPPLFPHPIPKFNLANFDAWKESYPTLCDPARPHPKAPFSPLILLKAKLCLANW